MDELSLLIRESIEYYTADIHTVLPGVVVKYDAKTRRADIQPSLKRKMPGGKYLEFPVIPDVPVRYSGNKEFTIHFPLKKGDEVLLFVTERGTDKWKSSGGQDIEEPDLRRFDIQDCIAITGNAPKDFIAVEEPGLNIVHKKDFNGEFICSITLDDDKIECKTKNSTFTQKIDGNTKSVSKDFDIESEKPVGIEGTKTQLGAGTLQPYWDDETKAWGYTFIPPAPWPSGAPVPPVPPIICMALNGLKAAILQADTKVKAACSKAIK